MKKLVLLFILVLVIFSPLFAQKDCGYSAYRSETLQKDPALISALEKLEQIVDYANRPGGIQETVIRIPVVIHNLYHFPTDKISDEQVMSQLEALNNCFRRRNADSVNTPVYFRQFAADCSIEFQLAISDPQRRSTTGIVRKYTPITTWQADDKMKFSNQMGDDAWDPASYLNIWVCNLDRVAGYSSLPGGDPAKDGVVLGIPVFGTINVMAGYEMGKTAVHEIGHWLNLKHIWGDNYCGDDGVADTPKQAGYNIECPNTVNVTCGNGPYGDMYMNYMDLTNDRCMNLFTLGQKARMRNLFVPGAPRYKLLASTGLQPPLIAAIPLPEEDPRWLHPKLFPNPATNYFTLDLTYDPRWLGKEIRIINGAGRVVLQQTITNKISTIDISKLPGAIYFIAAKKDDGESMVIKFIKL
jgi:hypothetical protein